MTVVAMSHGELCRYATLLRVERGELRVEDAATLLKLGRRQIFRLLGRLLADGAAGLVSSKRGKPSNRRYSGAFRERVIAVVREQYNDFGPTLAREYLAERHDIHLACETLRLLMIEAGLWKDRDARRPRPYQPRTAATVAASSSRSTGQSIGGSRSAGRNAPCSCSSTMRRASCCI